MPSERVQRQIDRLLDEAEAALARREWPRVHELSQDVLALDPANADARAFMDAAVRAGAGAAGAGASQPAAAPEAPSPPLPTSFAAGRYAVRRFLGEGGRKRVYLAHDERLDRDVAVALIKTEGLDVAGLARVQREAQAMGRLGDHPHIVTIHDVGDDHGQPYIVSQYMSGGAVDDLELPLPTERTLEIAAGVCRGLAHAHAYGVVHRDLKSGNVWIAGDGTAKIGDFGLAVALDRSRVTMQGMMVGTVAYMAPEQALGGETTPRADLYSLGCMLYQLVTGRPPFLGDDPTAVISQHINQPPVAPSWLTEHCPPDLEELILRLLAKDPGERPASARDVLSALERIDPSRRSASHSESNILDRLARGVFVGREKELDRLRKAFDDAYAGRGSMVMLVGEPGIGKTRAAQELETYARMRGSQVLWGRAHESSGAPAYWPWIQVGNSYTAAGNDLTLLTPDMQGKGVELVRLFPFLRQGLVAAEPEQIADPEAAQFRLFDAYATFVRAMSNRAPLLLALDDLHWADKPSLLLLEYIARELSRMRVLIVCTYRDTDLSRTHPLSEALAVLNREAGFQRVVLRGLSRDEVAGYIRAAANVTPKPELIDRIFEETEGNPFFLSEVVNLLTQEGKLTESVSDIAVPDGVREALGRRLDRISEEANELLQVAAVAGREFPYETLTLLSDRHEDELLRLIEEALEARVIEEMEQPGRYRFTHALMQETLLDELSTTRRVRIHGQVGEALEQRWGARAEERATRLAAHFVEAAMVSPRHATKAVHYSKLAAQQTEQQFAWDVAATHYQHCLTLVSDSADALGEDEAALLVSLGICQRNDGAPRAAWRSLMRAITVYGARGNGPGVAAATLEALLVDTRPERVVALARDALAALGNGDPYLEAQLLARLTFGELDRWLDDDEPMRIRERVNALLATHGYEDVRALLYASDSDRASQTGDFGDGVALSAAAHDAFDKLGRPGEAARALFFQASWTFVRGDLDGGRALAERCLAYAKAHNIRWSEENAAAILAVHMLARCDFESFDRMAEERAADASYPIPLMKAWIAELRGDHERAVALLPDPGAMGGVPLYLSQVFGARVRVLFNAGRVEQARDEFAAQREAMKAYGNSVIYDGIAVHGTGLSLMGEALADLADDAFIRAALMAFRQWEESTTPALYDPVACVCVPRRSGDLALRCGLIARAHELYERALAWCERERCPIEAGRCLQGLAEVADRRGDRAEALHLLDRAAALFREHGAKLYLDRVIAKKLELQGIRTGSTIFTSIDAVARTVEQERPSITVHPAPDGTVTIMFSDIEDSTVLTERLGDQRWHELLQEHNALIRKQIREHGGFEVKTIGDAFMVAFQSAKKALDCAIAIQRAFAEHNAADGEQVKVRIGLHAGEAIKDGDDFYGKNVILASRVAGKAAGGEILVSSLLRQLVESSVAAGMFGAPRQVEIKGLAGTHTVYAISSR